MLTSTPKPSLTARQKQILAFIGSRRTCPSFREIADHCGMVSPHAVECHLRALERKGVITRIPRKARSILLTEKAATVVPLCTLPFGGSIG